MAEHQKMEREIQQCFQELRTKDMWAPAYLFSSIGAVSGEQNQQ